MFSLSLFRAQPDQFECLLDQSRQYEDTQVEKKNVSNWNPLCYELQIAQAAEGSCTWLTVVMYNTQVERNTFQATHTPGSTTSFTPGCTVFLVLHLAAFTVSLHHCAGFRISAQNSCGKCRDQLHSGIHAILKAHVNVKLQWKEELSWHAFLCGSAATPTCNWSLLVAISCGISHFNH